MTESVATRCRGSVARPLSKLISQIQADSVTVSAGNAADTMAANAPPDLTAGLTLTAGAAAFNTITFSGTVTLAANKNLSATASNSITVNGNLTTSGLGTITLTAADVSGSGDLTTGGGLVVSNTGTSTLSGVIAGGGGATLTKQGLGTLILPNTHTYAGATQINSGILNVNGSTAAASFFTVNGPGTLGGTGTVGGPVNINSGGSVAPGTSPGILNSGNVGFGGGSTFTVEINGTTAGSGYDQLNVTGTVALGNATFALSGTHTPVAGQAFTIVNNDDADTVTGTFSGLAEGATISNFLGSPLSATITYAGGTNSNDVLLTVFTPCTPPSTVYVDDDWASTTPGTDPDMGGPATNFGCDSFATIQEGIDGVATGGTVMVNAGDYTEQPIISKNLTLTGANTATTVLHTPATLSPRIGGTFTLVQVDTSAVVNMSGLTIDGPYATANGCADPIYYGIFVVGGANLNLHDAAVTDVRLSPNSLLGCQTGIAIRAGSMALGQTATLTVNNVAITGYQKSAIVVDNTGSSGTITNNTITGLGLENIAANAIQISRGAGATITGNTITANQCTNPACGPDPLTQSTSTGVLIFSTSATLLINSNTISNNDTGIYNFGDDTTISGNTMAGNRFNGIFLDQGNATIDNNTLSGPMDVGVLVVAFTAADGTTGNSVGSMTSNTVTGATTGLRLLDSDASGDLFEPLLTAHFNRIISNTTAIAIPVTGSPESIDLKSKMPKKRSARPVAIMDELGELVGPKPIGKRNLQPKAPPTINNLENNWWGCNAGPGNTGCGTVTSTSVDYNPWIVLKSGAAPTTVIPGGTSTVTADMTFNSDNVVPVGTLPNIPDSWSATNGTMTPPTGTVVAGADSSTFTSTNGSNAQACVTVDNQPLCNNITVTAPSFSIDDVTHNEGNAGTTTYTFTVTKSGSTLLNSSVQFQTQDGSATLADNDYQTNTNTLTFGPSDTTMPVTVLVNGDTTVEPTEAFTVNLFNPVNATISDANGTGTINNDDCAGFSTVYVDDDWVVRRCLPIRTEQGRRPALVVIRSRPSKAASTASPRAAP